MNSFFSRCLHYILDWMLLSRIEEVMVPRELIRTRLQLQDGTTLQSFLSQTREKWTGDFVRCSLSVCMHGRRCSHWNMYGFDRPV